MSLTLNEAWRHYHDLILKGRKSEKSETGRWKNHIAPVVGEMFIEELTNFNYLQLKRRLEEKELSPQTIRHCLSLIQRVIRRAQEWGHINCVIPIFRSLLPKFDNKRERFLNQEEAKQLLACLSDLDKTQEWHDIAQFALCTGLRKGEIFNLKFSHIDFASQFLKIVDTKTHANRIVPFNEICRKLLIEKKTPLPAFLCLQKNHQKHLQKL